MMNKVKEFVQSNLFGVNKKAVVAFETDSKFINLYELAQEKTGMRGTDNLLRRQRHYTLIQLIRLVMPLTSSALVAECGCWHGLSAYQLAYQLKETGFRNKFIIFDSFEGLSDFREEDTKNNLILDAKKRKKEFACSMKVVQDNLKEFNFIEYKQGWIPERFSEFSTSKFAFVHIDVDLYQPIKDSLEFFFPRLVSQGIIVLDDYGYLTFPGAKKATDEFMQDRNDFFLHLPSGSAFIIKK